jgi:hypothetical protein
MRLDGATARALSSSLRRWFWRTGAFDDPLRKITNRYQPTSADGDSVFNRILKFTNISGPGVPDQKVERFLANADLVVARASVFSQKMLRQKHDIIRSAIAERRKMDRHHAQSIEEVSAEFPARNELFEVDIGGTDDTNIDGTRLAAANTSNLFLLQNPEQAGLKGLTGPAKFVKKDRSAVGALKEPGAVGGCPGKAPPGIHQKAPIQEEFRSWRSSLWP